MDDEPDLPSTDPEEQGDSADTAPDLGEELSELGAQLESEIAKLKASLEPIEPDPPVEFPSEPSDDKTKITRKRSFPAWIGRPDRLHRIAAEVESALRRAFEDSRPMIEAASRYERRSLIDAFAPETRVQASSGRIERKGALDAILGDIDAREVEFVEITNSPWRSQRVPRVLVKFGRESGYTFSRGVSVEIMGSDKQWVAATYDTLVTEVARDVPRWSFLLRDRSYPLYMLVVWLLAAAAILSIGKANHIQASDRNGWLGLAAYAAIFLGGVLAAAVHRFTPSFELVEAGQRSTVTRVGSTIIVVLSLTGTVLTIWSVLP